MTLWMTEEMVAEKIAPRRSLVMAMMVCASRRRGAGVMPEMLTRFDTNCFPTREHALKALTTLEEIGALHCGSRMGENAAAKLYGYDRNDRRSWFITDLGRRAIAIAVGASRFARTDP